MKRDSEPGESNVQGLSVGGGGVDRSGGTP